MKDRILLLACPLLVAMSLIACSEAEPPAAETGTKVASSEPAESKPVYNAVAPAEPEVFDNGERVLLDAPLINGLIMPFDYSVLDQDDSQTGPIRILKTEMEVFGTNEVEAVAQLNNNLQAEGFQLLNNKGTQGKLHRSYARGGRTVFDGAETVDVVAIAYPSEKKPHNPAAKAHLMVTVSSKQG
ncbi:MAG: hypothetical protein KDI71_00175 [Xanthomonadales bacterium]|nr:hypothetical protein [Xanthomonadales bacterium]